MAVEASITAPVLKTFAKGIQGRSLRLDKVPGDRVPVESIAVRMVGACRALVTQDLRSLPLRSMRAVNRSLTRLG